MKKNSALSILLLLSFLFLSSAEAAYITLKTGTLTDGKYCTYSTANGLVCNSDVFTGNTAITAATKTKITYDAKGLVTAGADATTADIASSLDKRYVTDAQIVVIGNTSGTNSGDETTATIKTKLGAASGSADGYLTSADWTTFNSKQNALTLGNFTETTSSVLTITGGTSAIIGSGLSVQVKQANGTTSGYLSSTDWTTFNNKGAGTVTSVAALTLGTTGTDLSSTVATGTTTPVITLNVPTASATNRGALSSADWTTFNSKQAAIANGTANQIWGMNGAATAKAWKAFATGTTGTDFGIAHTDTTVTFNIPTASSTNRGLLSSTDWSTFNAKADRYLRIATTLSGGSAAIAAGDPYDIYEYSGTGNITVSGCAAGNKGQVITIKVSGAVTAASPSVISAPSGSIDGGTYNISVPNNAIDIYCTGTANAWKIK